MCDGSKYERKIEFINQLKSPLTDRSMLVFSFLEYNAKAASDSNRTPKMPLFCSEDEKKDKTVIQFTCLMEH